MTGSSNRDKDHFHELDYQIMKHVFELHNRMGNSHDEEVYRNELLHLLIKDGLAIQAEVPLRIAFRSFEKTYYMDLLAEQEHVYELKSIRTLTNPCRGQLINYQLISEKPFGKLINLGSPLVEHEFSTSTMGKEERRNISINLEQWDNRADPDQIFLSLSAELFADWGSRLDPMLYAEALQHLLPESAESRIDIVSEHRRVGSKLVRLARPSIAFKITTSKTPLPLAAQFQKFINHTNLTAMCWINLNGNQITYRTLRKG